MIVTRKRNGFDIDITRYGSWKLGNPFYSTSAQSRRASIERFRAHVLDNEEFYKDKFNKLIKMDSFVKGKLRLGCYCKPQACHGDVIRSLCDRIRKGENVWKK